MVRAIHQVTGVYAERDAVGTHTTALRDAIRARGIRSEIFADEHPRGAATRIRSTTRLESGPTRPDTILVYQASSYARAAEIVARRNEPLVVNYHNVTPAAFFARWEPTVAEFLVRARHQMQQLARRTVLAIADSEFNAEELRRWGYPRVAVAPVLIDSGRLDGDPSSPWPTRTGARWLFVGRIAPNKAQHQIVKAFKIYRDVYDPNATLALPGRSSSHRYHRALDEFITAIGLDEVVLRPGSVPDAKLGGFYRGADVFVCMSEHEGFCNTVIEAMATGVPVVTLGSTALPKTVGDAALVLPTTASPATVAAAVRRVTTDRSTRSALTAAGRARHGELALSASSERLCDLLLGLARR